VIDICQVKKNIQKIYIGNPLSEQRSANHKSNLYTPGPCAFFFWVRFLFLRIAKKKRNEKKVNKK